MWADSNAARNRTKKVETAILFHQVLRGPGSNVQAECAANLKFHPSMAGRWGNNSMNLFELYDSVIPQLVGPQPKALVRPMVWPLPTIHGPCAHAGQPLSRQGKDVRRVFADMPDCRKVNHFLRDILHPDASKVGQPPTSCFYYHMNPSGFWYRNVCANGRKCPLRKATMNESLFASPSCTYNKQIGKLKLHRKSSPHI